MSLKYQLIVLAIIPYILAGCISSDGMKIGSYVKHCCPGDYENYQQYSLEARNMPAFLRDYVILEFDQAMSEKGLVRNEGEKQLKVLLSYNHVNLNAEHEPIDPFVRTNGMNTELNYIAVIEIEMYEESSGELVWAGSISRLHHVFPGEYMHEGSARPEFRNAFSKLLEAYPS